MRPRPAVPEDAAAAIARIYNGGIEERVATFETHLRMAEEILSWFGGRRPVVVVEEGGEVLAFAATSEYRSRGCYAGVAEFSVYADRGVVRFQETHAEAAVVTIPAFGGGIVRPS